LEPKPHSADAQGLLNARPARTEPAVARLLTLDPLKITDGSQTITVFEENHGRSTSDVVRFRNGEGQFGISSSDINNASGFTITKVDANNYTFTASGTATATTNIGGGSITAGPVTLTP
jgi:glycine cleavage system aminomethyltransferase T